MHLQMRVFCRWVTKSKVNQTFLSQDVNNFGTEASSILNCNAWVVHAFLSFRKKCQIFFSLKWEIYPILKPSCHNPSAGICLHCSDLMIWVTSTRRTLSKTSKHSDLQSWIRVLSYLPKLFASILLSFLLSVRKLASFTAVTAELIVPHYPRDKATMTLS